MARKWYGNRPVYGNKSVYLTIFWSETPRARLRAGKATARKRGRSASDSPTLELVNKKKVRNSTK